LFKISDIHKKGSCVVVVFEKPVGSIRKEEIGGTT